MDDAALYQLFADYGAISANVQVGFDGRSRGFGIVKFGSTEDASVALGDFNGFEHDRRQLSVRFDAKPQGGGGTGARGFQGGGGSLRHDRGFVLGIFCRTNKTRADKKESEGVQGRRQNMLAERGSEHLMVANLS